MMKMRFILSFFILAALTPLGLGLGPGAVVSAEEAPPIPEEDMEVLASGPIHEAFAEAVAFDPEQGIVVPKEPPPLIEEIPPEQKPEGDVQWIPGYWAWDDERAEYIWVSGIWRVLPPDREWVPGYWAPVSQGYQWISGYWASVKTEVTEYFPEPPESVEIGPSSNAPSPEYTWMPGCWLWRSGRYAWRPGYWAVADPGWIWVPAHYVWTPHGYIFVSGYWDHTVIHRGVLFAPVFFHPRSHFGLTFSFSPAFVISLNVFDDALFVRPRYCHYYYGDYYAPRHYRRGIYPWFSLHARRVVYDPIYAHQRWDHRKDHGWEKGLQTTFRERREQEKLRSPRGFGHSPGPDRTVQSSTPAGLNYALPLDRAEKSRAGAYRLTPLSKEQRKEFSQREKEVRTFQEERRSRETRPPDVPEVKASKKPAPNKEKTSRSPIVDRSTEKADRKKAPPARYRAPKPNPNVEPLQRKYDVSRAEGKSGTSQVRRQRSEVRGQGSEIREQRSGNRAKPSQDRSQTSEDKRQGSEVRGQGSGDSLQQSGNVTGPAEDRRQKPNNRRQRGDDGQQSWNRR